MYMLSEDQRFVSYSHSWKHPGLFATISNNSNFFCGVCGKKNKSPSWLYWSPLWAQLEKCKTQQIHLGWILINWNTKVSGFLTKIGT